MNIIRPKQFANLVRFQRGHVTMLTAILFVVIGLTTMGMYNVGQQSTNKVRVQTVSDAAAHSVAAGLLPGPHKDPFDRMLVAQAQVEQLTVVTRDPIIAALGAQATW